MSMIPSGLILLRPLALLLRLHLLPFGVSALRDEEMSR